jgi:hypothetical protein
MESGADASAMASDKVARFKSMPFSDAGCRAAPGIPFRVI